MDTTTLRDQADRLCPMCAGDNPGCTHSSRGVLTATDEWLEWSNREISRTRSVLQSCSCAVCDEPLPHTHWMADQAPPCEALELEPPCEVCDGTGEVTEAAGRAGRATLPCLNCNAYDLQQELQADLYTEPRKG